MTKESGPVYGDAAFGSANDFSRLLTEDLLYHVNRPGQYLGNEWGAARRSFDSASVRLCLAFPDLYELGMSNFGQRILYQIVNRHPNFMADRSYAPASDMEALVRQRELPLWAWESRRPLRDFDLLGFSLAYELTYTNVLNMLDLAGIAVKQAERTRLFPLVFAGGPSTVNPEPMALFFDFFIIGDGEKAVPEVMEVVRAFKDEHTACEETALLRRKLLSALATSVCGVYVPSLYVEQPGSPVVKPAYSDIPERVLRQTAPLDADNQPVRGIVPYLATVHDRQVLEVRRGCDRGCRFCQPGYTFLPVRERSTEELLALSKEALDNTGYQEYSLLSLCVSDYTSLYESVRALNREHAGRRASMSFPSQRADRMNLDVAEELKAVRKSGITLAPEAGTERLRAVINKGLKHEQIIDAITAAYASGWQAVKLYFMIGLPTEEDADLQGIIDILKEATEKCRHIRRSNPDQHKRDIEFTCTMSNFVPKPFTPFQWFGQTAPDELARRQSFMKEKLREARLRNVTINFTDPEISLLESVLSRGDRSTGEMVFKAWQRGAVFDAWDERFRPEIWHEVAREMGTSLEQLSCTDREVGSRQPWDVVHCGLADWWLVNEWKKAMEVKETAPCTENKCHACGVCTELDTTHLLASPKPEVMKMNPFVKELNVTVTSDDDDSHPSLFVMKPPEAPPARAAQRLRFEFTKTGELKFIGHLDLQHLFQRAARRAGISLSYTEGFNPGPKLTLALSLSLYVEGLAEVGEAELCEPLGPDEFLARMNRQLPPEIRIVRARTVEKSSVSLQEMIRSAVYRASIAEHTARATKTAADTIRKRVSELLAREKVEIEQVANPGKRGSRKRRDAREQTVARDIRPGIFSMRVCDTSPPAVEMELAHGSRLHVKPQDVLRLIDADADWRISRLALVAKDGNPLFNQ